MTEHTPILEAVARGWAHEDTAEKGMDVVLAEAIVEEVAPLFDELVAALEAVEWYRTSAKWGTKTTDVCPSCGETVIEGHAPDCQLAAALAKAKENAG